MSTQASAVRLRRTLKSWVIASLKPIVTRLFPPGSVGVVLLGPSRGLRYRIFADYGLAPLYGGWEPAAQRLMCAMIRVGGVSYDVGANYGIHTLLMARLVGSSGLVCAFEPVPKIATELRKNVQLNGFDNVCSVDAAVGNSNSLRRWSRGHHDGAGHLAIGADPTNPDILVQGVTIDSFVFESHNRPPGFIKIDVEGAESEVLAGAAKVLGAYHPTLLVDLHNPSEDVAVG